jgi:hypothetical protein
MPQESAEDDSEHESDHVPNRKQLSVLKKVREFFPVPKVRITIYGGITLIAGAIGAGLLNSHPKPVRIAWSLIFVACFFGAFAARLSIVNHKTAHPIPRWLPNLCCFGFILVALIGCTFAILQEQTPQSLAESERPFLEPSLVIDSVSESKVLYHYDVQNTGSATATCIRKAEYGEGFSDFEGPSSMRLLERELAPGQRMRIDLPPNSWPSDTGSQFSRTLVLFYDKDSFDITNEFRTEFRFFGSKEFLKPGVLHFGSSKKYLEPEKDMIETTREQLGLAIGDAWLIFNETNRNSMPAEAFVQNTNRSMQIDALNRKVVFWSLIADGRLIKLSLELKKSKAGFHVLGLSWNDSGFFEKVGVWC